MGFNFFDLTSEIFKSGGSSNRTSLNHNLSSCDSLVLQCHRSQKLVVRGKSDRVSVSLRKTILLDGILFFNVSRLFQTQEDEDVKKSTVMKLMTI